MFGVHHGKSDLIGRFHQACFKGKPSQVEKLLEAGVPVDVSDPETGWSGLHYAIENVNIPVVQCLLNHGANPNVQDKGGDTPLHFAVDAAPGPDGFYIKYPDPDSIAIVALLLCAGANPEVQNRNARTALAFAAEIRYGVGVTLMKRFVDLKCGNQ
jgi:ankyrin repeat protein